MAKRKTRQIKNAGGVTIPEAKEVHSLNGYRKYFPVILVVILAGIPFVAGKYIEFNSPGPFDSGAYVYSAAHVLDGAQIGVDEYPSAKIGTLAVNMLGVWLFGYNETGPEVLQAVLQVLALGFMYAAMFRLFGSLAAVFSVMLTTVFLCCPIFAKFGNVKEQYMIAFMVMGAGSYALGVKGKNWGWMVFAGAAASVAPLFKPTGTSVQVALGLFVLCQPLLGNRSWKQTMVDVGLMVMGAGIALGAISLWLLRLKVPISYMPYYFVWKVMLPGAINRAADINYITSAREIVPFIIQFKTVMKHYGLVILPIILAIASTLLRVLHYFRSWKLQRQGTDSSCKSFLDPVDINGVPDSNWVHTKCSSDFVLLFFLWWIVDMGYVWISPRSYEQYYLPLNASAAMLSGYLFCHYQRVLAVNTETRPRWVVSGMICLALMVAMTWQILMGIHIPGKADADPETRYKGYVSQIKKINQEREEGKLEVWEEAGLYLREHTQPEDGIFVWGWMPGIYVKAQRFCPSAYASTSEMHLKSPEGLSRYVNKLLSDFIKAPPEYMVDPHHHHFPYNRPPLELWPSSDRQLLPNDPGIIEVYEAQHKSMLKKRFGLDEMRRFEAMKPLRDYIMSRYIPVESFGVILVLKYRG